MEVEVIQYMRPSGLPVRQLTDISDTVEVLYRQMRQRGWRFTAECLRTGEISLTIEDPVVECDLVCRVVGNGPAVPLAMEEMLRKVFPSINKEAVNEEPNTPNP